MNRKRIVSLFLSLVLMLAMVPVASAQAVALNAVDISESILPIGTDISTLAKDEQVAVLSNSYEMVAYAAAPSLTSMKILSVESPKGGREYFASNQTQCYDSHGGSYLQIITKEIGIPVARGCRYSGSFNQSLSIVSTTYITQDRIIVGYQHTWRMNRTFSGGYCDVYAYRSSAPSGYDFRYCLNLY